MSSFLANTYANGTITLVLHHYWIIERFCMAHIYENNGRYTVSVGGIVIGYNLSRAEALKRLEDYDFD